MSRRKTPPKRTVLPDPKFNSILVTKFINGLLRGGKRSVAETIFYDAIDIIAAKTSAEGLPVFEKAMHNVRPMLEVRSRRVGGATYQVPTEVAPGRRQALAFRWIIGNSMSRAEKTMREKLAGELMDAAQNRGASVKKREDVHKMAEANKAFAHYRF